ncbi:MAG: IPT/TIG domain-containing protein [Planctomycetes bacterium]|nr:IPT/TIG domain-containing protein [Planctomycetota bacterium]
MSAWLAALAILAAAASAHISIPGLNHAPIRWHGPSVSYLLHPGGSDDVPDESDLLAVREAFESWNAALQGSLQLVETSGPNPSSKNVDELSTHRVVFDEDDTTGYFPVETGIVALTPIRYNSLNRIVDADIIFNGRDHRFSTSFAASSFDIRDVAAHEVGHFLGLDHSPQLGATLFPYVSYGQTEHRSLSEDEVQGARAVYGAGGPSARITGVLLKQKPGGGAGGPIRRGYVAVRRADGRVAGSTLSADDGSFAVEGLEPGQYVVEATPLDGPASALNLVSPGFVDTAFGAASSGPLQSPTLWSVGAGSTVDVGSIVAGAAGGPSIQYFSTAGPLRVSPGNSTAVTVGGTGLGPGSSATVPGDAMFVFSAQSSAGGTALTLQLFVLTSAAPGLYNLLITDSSGRSAIEVGAIEVVAPPPSISTVAPATASAAGGEEITILGTGFLSGSSVIFGDQKSPSVTFVSPQQIRAVTPASTGAIGLDVIVVSPDGQEGRKSGVFSFQANPQIAAVYPSAASATGGKLIRVMGSDFLAGASLELLPASTSASSSGGTGISAATVGSGAGWLEVTAPALPPGLYHVRIFNPDGTHAVAAAAFESVDQADPAITEVAPASASAAGGSILTLVGIGFATGATVRFGADPNTGLGGSFAPWVERVSSSELHVVVPPFSGVGPTTVLVELPSGQSDVSHAFAYTGGGGAGPNSEAPRGGGGGCAASIAPMSGGGPGAVPRLLSTFGALLAAAGVLAARARSLRLAPARYHRPHGSRRNDRPRI